MIPLHLLEDVFGLGRHSDWQHRNVILANADSRSHYGSLGGDLGFVECLS